jgi:hypothetical protein
LEDQTLSGYLDPDILATRPALDPTRTQTEFEFFNG